MSEFEATVRELGAELTASLRFAAGSGRVMRMLGMVRDGRDRVNVRNAAVPDFDSKIGLRPERALQKFKVRSC